MPAKDYFYYIDTTEYCSNGDFQLNTIGKANYANICAWKPSLPNVVYGCDAKNGVCWTSPQVCVLLPSIGSKWCCRDEPVERCGVTPSESFICWANDLDDDNPMRPIELDVARNPESVRSILSSMSLTISSPTALPIITTAFLTLSANNTDTATTAYSSDTSTTLAAPQNNDPTLPTGAVAGVAVGALLVLGLIIFGAIFILRHKKQTSTRHEPRDTQSEISANELSDTRAMYEVADSSCAELSGPRNDQRHELSS
ncbi:hypothetical protein PMIN01_07697 [Paraphaeosphaeria minitans]|uniref:Uncharacterized protein n=1 Tax=Paraphaeosphaeria minitans TaxID=565426 RepID=A0A9P6GII2_9PLEO|nr:hypothetical protein PMIN01_07697 [Paraphaeosphaeria minitans]